MMGTASSGSLSCTSPYTEMLEETWRGLNESVSSQASFVSFQNSFLSQSSVSPHPGPGFSSDVIYAD